MFESIFAKRRKVESINSSIIQDFSATWSTTDPCEENPSTIMADVVRLDVGGTKFKVSRSLIEQYPNTMLARLVSDTCQQQHHPHHRGGGDQPQEVFLDRDGETFRLVLTYMRDRKVFVPMKLAKKTVLNELDYLGFENVDESVIHSGCTRIQAASSLALYNKIHMERVEELKYTQHYEILAYECFKAYYTTGSLESIQIDKTNNERFATAPHIAEWNDRIFDRCLAEYGLICKSREMEPNQFLSINLEIMT
jgi:BTB/POZ domain